MCGCHGKSMNLNYLLHGKNGFIAINQTLKCTRRKFWKKSREPYNLSIRRFIHAMICILHSDVPSVLSYRNIHKNTPNLSIDVDRLNVLCSALNMNGGRLCVSDYAEQHTIVHVLGTSWYAYSQQIWNVCFLCRRS